MSCPLHEFLKVFDGYSIGSNDPTQLTLGLDRDSGPWRVSLTRMILR